MPDKKAKLDVHKRLDRLQADVVILAGFCHYLCHEIRELQGKYEGASSTADWYRNDKINAEQRAHDYSLLMSHFRAELDAIKTKTG